MTARSAAAAEDRYQLPKSITAGQVNEVYHRLKALGAAQGAMPIPKGPMPKSAKQAKEHARLSPAVRHVTNA